VEDTTFWQFQQRGMSPVLLEFLSRASISLLTQAREVLKDTREEQWRFAVVLAHAACDLQTEQAINDLIELKQVGYLRAALQKTKRANLDNDCAKKVYAALSDGDQPWLAAKEPTDPPQADWWSEWSASWQRRCGVAHAGVTVTHDEANRTIDACEKYVLHLMRKVEDLTKPKS